ncbi:MAG TPA: hypothetical protein VFS33_00605 [Gemmatimonadales bacterium]|nr:hypothetical protein [Gemmatimonadales bacterium]
MKTNMAVGAAALALAMVASPAPAQTVQAGVVIRSGPVRGHVVVGEPVAYREPARRVVVVERYHPRTIVVERMEVRRYPRGWWKRHGYVVTTAYYDDRADCYYDRRISNRRGLREVTVYVRDGRYYRMDGDDRYYRRDRNDRHDDGNYRRR